MQPDDATPSAPATSSTAGSTVDAKGKSSWGLKRGDVVAPRCQVREHLGGGKRFEVFSAFDDRMLATVVVKALRPEFVDRAGSLKALRREIDIIQKLDHPNIVRCYHAASEGDRPYLALARISGRTLNVAIRKEGSYSPSKVVVLGLGLASAAHYLHERDIIHLDIKPSNVMVGSFPTLIDFSLARETAQAKRLAIHVGTTPWMAPEQCAPPTTGRPVPASDVWGIGTTMYFALTGTRPFSEAAVDADAPLEQRYPQLVDDPKPLGDDVPDGLAELLRDMLQKDPAARPRTREVYRRLSALSHELAGRRRQ